MASKFASVLCVALWLLLAGCGQRESSEQAQPPSDARLQENPAPEPPPAPPDTVRTSAQAPSEVAETPQSEGSTVSEETPALTPQPAPSEKPPSPAEVLTPRTSQAEPEMTPPPPPPIPPAVTEPSPVSSVTDPGGTIEVQATKAGLSRIGAAKCKMCHKLQYTSWAASAHAKRTPPLDCESCHGAGSEYKAISVMKDPEKAKAAGLVLPGRQFCIVCHQGDWSDEMLQRAHAHKPATTSP